MGQAKLKRKEFFDQHKTCCFCGEVATTIDHVPSRAAFSNKIGPDGYEFPACRECNSSTASSEQVFAFYVRLMDQNQENSDSIYLDKLLTSIMNNHPEMMPDVNLSNMHRRRFLREKNINVPKGFLLKEIPLIGVPPQLDDHILRVGKKILFALYYKHTENILTNEFSGFVNWTQQALPESRELLANISDVLPDIEIGKRVNTSIGDQFAYRWGRNEDERLFGFVAGFGAGLVLFGGIAPTSSRTQNDSWFSIGE